MVKRMSIATIEEPSEHSQRKAMEKFKKLLGPKLAAQFTDDQIPQLQREMYAIAEILLDFYLEKKRRSADNTDGFDRQSPTA